MKKIKTLFKKDPNDLGRVINEVDPDNAWVYDFGFPTRKYDGTSCAVINGELYKRYDAKRRKKDGMFKVVTEGAIPCQDPDQITGHWPHWIKCDRSDNSNIYHFEAFDNESYLVNRSYGTYELCGEKIQGNPEKIEGHVLLPHGGSKIRLEDFSFDTIKDYLFNHDIEGIVFHHLNDDRMCKIRKSDFGFKR